MRFVAILSVSGRFLATPSAVWRWNVGSYTVCQLFSVRKEYSRWYLFKDFELVDTSSLVFIFFRMNETDEEKFRFLIKLLANILYRGGYTVLYLAQFLSIQKTRMEYRQWIVGHWTVIYIKTRFILAFVVSMSFACLNLNWHFHNAFDGNHNYLWARLTRPLTIWFEIFVEIFEFSTSVGLFDTAFIWLYLDLQLLFFFNNS